MNWVLNHLSPVLVDKMSYPELRFKEFKDEWQPIALGSFIIERNETAQRNVPIFSLTIQDGVTPKTERYERAFLVTDEDDAYKLVRQNDFAYNPMNLRFGAIAKYSKEDPVQVSKYYNIFYCNNSVNSNFCELYFKTHKMISFYDKMATGSLAEKKRVHFSDFLKFKIPFPKRDEQTKIANFLTAIDEKITHLTQKHDLLAQYKKGVMQQIFSQELRFKDDDGRDFPDWKENLVGEVFNDFKGTGLSKDKVGEVGKNKCILYGHLFTRYSEVITKIDSRTDFEEGFLSEANDILMPSSTTTKGVDLAKASSLNQSGVLLGGDIIVLRLKEKGNSNFFAYLLTHAKSKDIAEITQGITIIHLYFSQLKNILLNYPCDKEQTKIANFLTAIDDKIIATQTQLQAVKQYKQGLLQQMFV